MSSPRQATEGEVVKYWNCLGYPRARVSIDKTGLVRIYVKEPMPYWLARGYVWDYITAKGKVRYNGKIKLA